LVLLNTLKINVGQNLTFLYFVPFYSQSTQPFHKANWIVVSTDPKQICPSVMADTKLRDMVKMEENVYAFLARDSI